MRDTGRSTSYPMDGKFYYSRVDLINDALTVMNVLKIPYFHVVGFGFGGSLAGELSGGPARSRVKSLTLLWSSPTGLCTVPEDRLPLPDLAAINAAHACINAYPQPKDWTDREAVITYMGYVIQLNSGRWFSHDEKVQVWHILNRAFDRAAQAKNILQSSFNHVKYGLVRWPREVLRFIRCSTLIMHTIKNGSSYPLEHAYALKEDIRGSIWVVFDQEQLAPDFIWREVARSILDIVEKGEKYFLPPPWEDPRSGQQAASGPRPSTLVSEVTDLSSRNQQNSKFDTHHTRREL